MGKNINNMGYLLEQEIWMKDKGGKEGKAKQNKKRKKKGRREG